MPKTASAPAGEVQTWRQQTMIANFAVTTNVDGVTHEDSLLQPRPNGNCINWVLGHLVVTYDKALSILGEKPVIGLDGLKNYDRGAPPLKDPAAARDFTELLAAWGEATKRIDTAIDGLTPEQLDRPVPSSPSGNPDETVRTLLTSVMWHQAYHAGQLGVLRRVAGKAGAIK